MGIKKCMGMTTGYSGGRLESGKKYLGVYNYMGKVSFLKLSRECKGDH